MPPKPKHLGPEYAAQFQDQSMADVYQQRPPYPAEVFSILADLISDTPRAVLDIGCGDGVIARKLIDRVERVDAVDFSQAMIAQGQRLPGGDHPKLRWIAGRAEDAPLHPPYALITAGASLHWMDWEVVFPRFRQMLTSNGLLAIVDLLELPEAWSAAVQQLIPRYSTNQDYLPYDLVEELEQRHLFKKHGEQRTTPILFGQSIDAYIESFHSRNGFSRERMRPEMAAAFDAEVKNVLTASCRLGLVPFHIVGVVVWGTPR